MGAGGRAIVEGVAGAALVALTRLVNGSAGFGSAALGSASFGSAGRGSTGLCLSSDASALTRRGRGNGLASAQAPARITPAQPENGAGVAPAPRDNPLPQMGLV